MKITYNEQYNFNHLQADEDMVIIDFIDGDDILNYVSFKQAYCPANADLSRYYEITDAKDAEYKQQQEMAIKLMENNEN